MDTDSSSYRYINRSKGGLENADDEMATERPRVSQWKMEFRPTGV